MATIVQLVHLDETGDSYYRMRWPARDLAAQEPGWTVINLDAAADERLELALKADLLVIYQSHDDEMLNIMLERRKRGLKTLVEYNDNFYEPPPSSPVFQEWSSPLIWSNYEQFMELADAIIVTGPGLFDLLAPRFKERLIILENHLPEAPVAFNQLLAAKPRELTFGWAGSVGHMGDLLAIIPVVKSILSSFPEAVFCVMGNESIPAETGLPLDKIRFTPWGGMKEYYEFLHSLKIGLIPVLSTAYNQCRSDIKAVEYASRGVLPLIAPATPYHDFIAATGAPVFRDLSELESQLVKLLTHPSQISTAAQRCHEYVQQQRLGSQNFKKLESYRQFLLPGYESGITGFQKGYQEFRGQVGARSGVQTDLMQVQRLKNAGKPNEALALAHKVYQANPLSLQACYGFCLLLGICNHPDGLQVAQKMYQQFPRDLRFPLLQARLQKDMGLRTQVWLMLLAALEQGNQHFKKFYERSVCSQFSEQFSSLQRQVELLNRLLNLYPHAIPLRMLAAKIFEQQGLAEKALDSYEIVERLLRESPEFADSSDSMANYSYVATWIAALRARISCKL